MFYIAIILSAIAIVLTIIDGLQTVHIARNPHRFFERNPILGRHPSVQRVLWYFAACLILELIGLLGLIYTSMLGLLLLLSMLLIALEGFWVVSNHRLGIRLG